MTTFREEMYLHYATPNGCFHAVRDPSEMITSGNHAVINATYYLIQHKLGGVITDDDKELARRFIENCRNSDGTINRAPGKNTEDEAHDDLIGICVTSKICDFRYAKEIYDYGNKWRFPKLFGLIPIPTKWYYDNTAETPNFNIKHCYWRFGWVVSVLKSAAGEKLNWFDKMTYKLYLWLNKRNTDKTDTSGRILRWLSVELTNKEFEQEVKVFEDDILKLYTSGMKDVMSVYYGITHPFAIYCPLV